MAGPSAAGGPHPGRDKGKGEELTEGGELERELVEGRVWTPGGRSGSGPGGTRPSTWAERG